MRLGTKRKPKGWELIEEALFQFEDRLREAVDDPHEGKRKCEANWPIHRIHYERNRYIYDLYYKQQRISRELYEFLVREKVVLLDADMLVLRNVDEIFGFQKATPSRESAREVGVISCTGYDWSACDGGSDAACCSEAVSLGIVYTCARPKGQGRLDGWGVCWRGGGIRHYLEREVVAKGQERGRSRPGLHRVRLR